MIFNLIISLKKSDRYTLNTFMKLHMIGIKDPHFLTLANQLLDYNAQSFCYHAANYNVIYIWWQLGEKKVHRDAIKSRVEYLMNSAAF